MLAVADLDCTHEGIWGSWRGLGKCFLQLKSLHAPKPCCGGREGEVQTLADVLRLGTAALRMPIRWCGRSSRGAFPCCERSVIRPLQTALEVTF